MSKHSITTFNNGLQKANTEEDVKGVFTKHFDIQYDTAGFIDLYTKQVLFEFKFDKNLNNLKHLAYVLAQNLYYVRRLKFGITAKPIPPMLCLAAQNFAVLSPTIDWKTFYSDDAYDWDLAPSSPDKTLIEALHKSTQLKALQIYKIDNATQAAVFAE